jgi:hypothetical protein
LENSVVSALGVGKPVSKYAARVTGDVPQVGGAANDVLGAAAWGLLPPGPLQPAASDPPNATAASAARCRQARVRRDIDVSSELQAEPAGARHPRAGC